MHNNIILAVSVFPLLHLAASDQLLYENTNLQSVYSKAAVALELLLILLKIDFFCTKECEFPCVSIMCAIFSGVPVFFI